MRHNPGTSRQPSSPTNASTVTPALPRLAQEPPTLLLPMYPAPQAFLPSFLPYFCCLSLNAVSLCSCLIPSRSSSRSSSHSIFFSFFAFYSQFVCFFSLFSSLYTISQFYFFSTCVMRLLFLYFSYICSFLFQSESCFCRVSCFHSLCSGVLLLLSSLLLL